MQTPRAGTLPCLDCVPFAKSISSMVSELIMASASSIVEGDIARRAEQNALNANLNVGAHECAGLFAYMRLDSLWILYGRSMRDDFICCWYSATAPIGRLIRFKDGKFSVSDCRKGEATRTDGSDMAVTLEPHTPACVATKTSR